MTADIEMLPLPLTLRHPSDKDLADHVQTYARAVAEHNVKERDAEIEALREALRQAHKDYGCELRDPNGTIWEYAARQKEQAERLAEALRDIESRPWNGVRPIQIAARAALRDHDQEVGNG